MSFFVYYKCSDSYTAQDGTIFPKSEFMSFIRYNLSLIDYSEFKDVYWISRTYNSNTHEFDIKIEEFAEPDYNHNHSIMLRLINHDYLSIPYNETIDIFRKWKDYFRDIDDRIFSELKPGLNYVDDMGNLTTVENSISERRKKIYELNQEISDLEDIEGKIKSNILEFIHNRKDG
jgi:hypothetical protein